MKRPFKRKRPTDIAIVGIDGCGKTTVAGKLQQALREKGLNVAIIDAPHFVGFKGVAGRVGGYGKRLIKRGAEKGSDRKILAGSAIAGSAFRAARVATRKSDVRLFQRDPVTDATAITAVYAGKIPRFVTKSTARAVAGPLPDAVIHLRVPPEVSVKRIAERNVVDEWGGVVFKHEKLENLERMEKANEKRLAELRAKGVRVFEIDTTLPREEVSRQVQKLVVEELVGKKRKRLFRRKRSD
ncbi:MAG: hypothetical protein NT067_04895 [Candidatus Diapherotrites archaeon]|nr:hypothetical protein [Candidatus Diapherotrites archaeon]